MGAKYGGQYGKKMQGMWMQLGGKVSEKLAIFPFIRAGSDRHAVRKAG